MNRRTIAIAAVAFLLGLGRWPLADSTMAAEPAAKLPPWQKLVDAFGRESFKFEDSVGNSNEGGMQVSVQGPVGEPHTYQCSMIPGRKSVEDVGQLTRWRSLFLRTVLSDLSNDELTALDKFVAASVEGSKRDDGVPVVQEKYRLRFSVLAEPETGYSILSIKRLDE